MAVSVEVPDLGGDMAGGLVAEWYQADGASVGAGDPVCRVECSFVAFDLEAEDAGVLWQRKPAGSIERPGAVLGVILAPGESMPSSESLQRPVEPVPAPVAEAPGVPVEELEPSVEPEPLLEEFQEALVEAVVVPFPRRFAAPAVEWAEAPGDKVDFDSALFGPTEEERAAALSDPGGSIPGLPLWEPEDTSAGRAPYGDPATSEESDSDDQKPVALRPALTPLAPDSLSNPDDELGWANTRFARISAEAAAAAQVLTMAVEIEMAESRRMLTIVEREWRRFGSVPLLEDLVLRALAISLDEYGAPATVGALLIAEAASDVSCAIEAPAQRSLREAVAARERGGDAAFERADWTLVSLAAQRVASATPRLDPGREIAFALGGVDRAGVATLTMGFDSSAWSEGSAARLLSRARDILEAPYAMLV